MYTAERLGYAIFVAFMVGLGCKSPKTAEPDADHLAEAAAADATTTTVPAAAAGTLDAGASPKNPSAAFRDDVRRARWEDAETSALAMTDAERDKPLVKLARARAALERNDAKLALGLLVKLEADLPLLENRIKRMRRAAMAEVGPFDVAAEGAPLLGALEVTAAKSTLKLAEHALRAGPRQSRVLEFKTEHEAQFVEFRVVTNGEGSVSVFGVTVERDGP